MIKKESFKYKIIYSRRRTLCISIRQDKGVVVRAPRRVSESEIERFISQKSGWITKHLNAQQTRIKIENERYLDGDIFLFRGKEPVIRLADSGQWKIVDLTESILISCPDKNDIAAINRKLAEWFRATASEIILSAIERILTSYNIYSFRPADIKLRKMKTRWGSCSSKGVITINYQLVRLAPEFLDYVILHELCHLKHHNHGKDYYSLLTMVYPDWKEIRKGLKKYQG